jgi:hypothetical protein
MNRTVKVNVYPPNPQQVTKLDAMYEQYSRFPFPARTTLGCNLRGIRSRLKQ